MYCHADNSNFYQCALSNKCGTSFIVIMQSCTSRWCLFQDAFKLMLGLIDGVSMISYKACLDQMCRLLVTNV